MREGGNKVVLGLFEHNEKAYHTAVRMMEQYGKATIVHPTGTGKSYIAFKLIEDNPEKVVIWLSPSEYIFKTQLESLKRNDPDFSLVNVHFYTYAKLMCCTRAQLDEIAAQKPAYIILDEFHRAGAKYWGNRNDRQWNEGYQETKRYFEAHGNLNVPTEYVSPNGYNLGNWVKRQRYIRHNPGKTCTVLTEGHNAKLDAIGMRWEKSNPKYLSEQPMRVETVAAKAG